MVYLCGIISQPLKNIVTITIVMLLLHIQSGVNPVLAQEDSGIEKQLWAMAFFHFRLDENWVYNQDVAYQHSYETPTFTRIMLRSQIGRQLTGAVSLHSGLNLMYKFSTNENDAMELRPWVGAKLRWPYFWRFNFVQYMRFEQRFEHTMNVDDWDNNFRIRYKISSSIPINHGAIVDKTFYGLLAYEFFSFSFGDDIRFTTAATHRFDFGLGYRQNSKNRYEALIVALNGLSADSDRYTLSGGVLFLRYKRYINWE